MVREGNDLVIERQAPVDVPRYRFTGADAFSEPWFLAAWAPHDNEGPTVVLNGDSSILQDIIAYHLEQYPDIYAEEVTKVVHEVFGEVAACKIAHSQKLAKMVATEVLDQEYRNEKALTLSLMGLMAEETLIAQRLSSRLGRNVRRA